MIPVDQFWSTFDEALSDGSCLGLTLHQRTRDAADAPEKLTVRPTTVKGARVYQWASRQDNRETHENLSPEQTAERFRELLKKSYTRARILTAAADFEVSVAPQGGFTVRRRPPSRSAAPLAHNRSKSHLIPEGVPCRFLSAIGVMTAAGKVRASRMAKFRQINRFLELVDDVVHVLPATGVLRVVDFGCGKSYLTFALHHLMTAIHKRDVAIVGFERRSDVVAQCARLGEQLGCRGLEFHVGEIAGQHLDGAVDLAVALHACDTATDDALAKAVAWQATAILAVPCCQHELARTLRVRELAPLTRHGVLHEHFASLATDALRAQALEACGYKTQVVEFIDMEHTAKNLLIRAVRRAGQRPHEDAARQTYDEFKTALGLAEVASDRIVAAGASTSSNPPT